MLGNQIQIFAQDSNKVILYDIPPFDFNKWYQELKDTVADIEGNIYHTIQLGNQIWMKENLRVSKYNDGKLISLIKSNAKWIKTTTDAYSIYTRKNGTSEYFYNYAVVKNTSNVCPCGWHIPDSTDWQILESFANEANQDFNFGSDHYYPYGDTIHLRKEIIDIWTSSIQGLSFSNQPFGYRSGNNGEYLLIGDYGLWWSSTGTKVASAWARIFVDRGLGIDDIHLEKISFAVNVGLSIRCIKD